MENLIKIDTVDQYNKMFGLETLHRCREAWRLRKQSPNRYLIPGGLGLVSGLFRQPVCYGTIRCYKEAFRVDSIFRRFVGYSWLSLKKCVIKATARKSVSPGCRCIIL